MDDESVTARGEKPGVARFGLFELDMQSGRLRRDGAVVRLQAQPARVLVQLVAAAGDVVSRDALREAVWGTDTFVDFDRGLNFAVAQIRSALGDSAESPRYVRTLPKRGYQFIAPVERLEQAAAGSPPPAATRSSRTLVAAAAAIFLVTLATLAALRWPARRAAAEMAATTIAVARFDNETDSADIGRFADGLTDAVTAELTAAGPGRFGVIGNAAALRVPRDRRDIRAIGAALGAGYVVLGQVQRQQSQVRVLAHLIHLPEQTHVAVARFDRVLEDPLRLQTELARAIAAQFSSKITKNDTKNTK